jgi:nodulation protein E
MGEGAGVFVFEDRDHALARGAEVLAEVAGFAMTADAGDIVAPSVAGAARTMQMALADAGMEAADVGYINAHGTGTALNDRVESAAILQVFGHRPLVSSTKATHGHVMGGTGAIELLACLMALRDGVVAPTIGYRTLDAECALDVVPNVARKASVTACLSNAFAFGGLNAVLALRQG